MTFKTIKEKINYVFFLICWISALRGFYYRNYRSLVHYCYKINVRVIIWNVTPEGTGWSWIIKIFLCSQTEQAELSVVVLANSFFRIYLFLFVLAVDIMHAIWLPSPKDSMVWWVRVILKWVLNTSVFRNRCSKRWLFAVVHLEQRNCLHVKLLFRLKILCFLPTTKK